VANSWKSLTGSAALSTVTALVRRIRCVRAAAAARMSGGAESRNSLRWCSPIPNESSPTLSAYSIWSMRLRRRSDSLTVRLSSVNAAAKLSIPIWRSVVCESIELFVAELERIPQKSDVAGINTAKFTGG